MSSGGQRVRRPDFLAAEAARHHGPGRSRRGRARLLADTAEHALGPSADERPDAPAGRACSSRSRYRQAPRLDDRPARPDHRHRKGGLHLSRSSNSSSSEPRAAGRRAGTAPLARCRASGRRRPRPRGPARRRHCAAARRAACRLRPPSRSSRSKIVPPRMIASRAEENDGDAFAHAVLTAGRNRRLAGEVPACTSIASPVEAAADLAGPRAAADGRYWRRARSGRRARSAVPLSAAASPRRPRRSVYSSLGTCSSRPSPTGEIAAPGGAAAQPRPGQERVRRRRQPGGVDSHGEPPGRVEALLESSRRSSSRSRVYLADLVSTLVPREKAPASGSRPG